MSAPLRAIYRVQLTPDNGFSAVRDALPYLQALGISHLYLSPIFASRPGSTHGYDVTNHALVNPELGGEEGFRALAAACDARGMGLVLDIVPNHMAVMTTDNAWWVDVLKNGAASQFADFFDIDWSPARASMRNRLLVPVLGDPLGEVIDQRGIRLKFDRRQGALCACYGSLQFPIDPQTYPQVFDGLTRAMGSPLATDEEAQQEFASVRDAFAALPPARAAAPEVLALRDRDQQVNQRRLARLCERHPELADRIETALQQFNELPDESTADTLATLLAAQPYRLAFWRVSGEEINYRRFFDVNELAALRVEDQRVFDATHELLRKLWQSDCLDGLRVDHADGLYDPQLYFHRLRDLLTTESGTGTPWIVAEKILGPAEELPADWELDGTTGYEFAALVTAWLMHSEGAGALEKIYHRFAGGASSYEEVAYHSRRHVMRTSLAAEISGLAVRLDRFAQLHRNTLDFTLFDLREAIVEVIANFPVYRTYIRDERVSSEDAQHIRRAVGAAMKRNQSAHRALQFLERVLLGELANDPRRRAAALEFTMKFQQVTAPVMAKGIEDTAYYRYPCLLAMNEVGGDPLCRGISTDALHRANEKRQREYPRSVLTTTTHDTKRGEDARHRLCVLTEIPEDWARCVSHWRRLKSRRLDASAVGAAQEYLMLQSLLAIWPMEGVDQFADLRARMEEYAVKAAREAKQHTSWLEPDLEYEDRLRHYVGLLLPTNSGTGFARYFHSVLDVAVFFGLLNTLSGCVLKYTAPGVPDTYQGSELPALVLVDPDNRRQPDLQAHAHRLGAMAQAVTATSLAHVATTLLASWRDGGLKLFITWRLLTLRAANPMLFDSGSYLPLIVEGEQAAHLCAYARATPECTLIVVVTRWAAILSQGAIAAPLGHDTWRDARILLPAEVPAGEYVDVFTGRTLLVGTSPDAARALKAAELFETLPVCVMMAGGLMPAVQTAAASGR